MVISLAEIKPVYESELLPDVLQALRQVFCSADKAVLQLAEQAVDNGEQNRYFEAVQQLRIIQHSLVQQFVIYWLSPFTTQFPVSVADAEHVASLRKLVSLSAAGFAGVLEELQQRFRRVDDYAQNPLHPDHIISSFLYSLADADLDVYSKMMVLRAFEGQLNECLPDCLQRANEALKALGVEPVALDEEFAPLQPQPDIAASDVAAALADLQALDYETLEQRLSVGVLLQRPAISGARNILQELSDLSLLKKPASAAEQVVVDDIQQLFTIILSDTRLSAPAYGLLACLQLPYTRIALQQAAFFAEEQNLAKSLLNEAVRLLAQWQPVAEQLVQDDLYQKLVQIITVFWEAERISQIPYQQMLFDLLLYGETERQQQQLSARRLRDTQYSAVQAAKVREQAEQLINSKMQGIKQSVAVRQLLDEGWKHVLYLAGLHGGTNSEDWHKAAAVVDDLAATLQAPSAYSTRTDFLVLLPSLLKSLREGLALIELEPAVINQLFAELEAEHKKLAMRIVDSDVDDGALHQAREAARSHCLQLTLTANTSAGLAEETELLIEQPADPVIDMPPAAMPVEEPVTPLDPVLQQAQEKLALLGPGAQILWTRDAVQERCRIAAFIKHTRTYILTNRSGGKVAECSEADMLQKLVSGEMETLESGQIFERALESVIGRIRDQR